MADMKRPVRFGIKNVYYAVINPETGTYATPKPLKGATKLSLNHEGNESTFYADDIPYATFSADGGYSVELTVAEVTDEQRRDLFGDVLDKSSVQFEDLDAKKASVALLFEFNGTVNKKRGCLYNVTFKRPNGEASTTNEGVTVDTDSISGKAIGVTLTIDGKQRNVVKSSVTDAEATKAVFDNWYKKVYVSAEA